MNTAYRGTVGQAAEIRAPISPTVEEQKPKKITVFWRVSLVETSDSENIAAST
jgi:hypothetical protein